MEQLGSRVARSGAWVFGMRFVHQFFYLGRLIILARLLAPEDFGLMGIALLTMMTLETFSQTGFQEALIQKKENTKDYLNAAWTVLVIRGVILFSIIVLIAPLVANFFETPQAKGVVQAIGIAILIQAFTNVGVVYFQKELEFHKQFIYISAGTVTDFAVAVTAAILMKSVWALLFGLVAGKIAQLIASYVIHPYKPKISLDFHKARELFGFGKWVFAGSIITFLLLQGDDLFVGKLIGITALGFYQMAYRISNTPATEISNIVSSVAFPAYSKIQDNSSLLRRYYLDILKFISFLAFPLTGFILILSPELTNVFLGSKWIPIIPLIQILSLYGLFRALNATLGPIFYAKGKPKFLTKLSFFQLIILVALIYPSFLWSGLTGVCIAVTLSNIICFLIGLNIIKSLLEIDYNYILMQIMRSALNAIIIVAAIIFIKYFFSKFTHDLIVLILSTIVSVPICFLINMNYIKKFKSSLRS